MTPEASTRRKRTSACPQCRGMMIEGKIELIHTYEGMSLTVKDVPAWVCRDCGKRLVTGDVAERINRLLDEIAGEGRGKRIR